MTDKVKLWRTLVRVESIRNNICRAIVSSWNAEQPVYFTSDHIADDDLRNKVMYSQVWPVRMFARINIGADNSDELIFLDFEEAPEPNMEDLL